MKVKTNELAGPALDWVVAKCEGITEFDRLGIAYVPDPEQPHFNKQFNPSTDWAQGGPIIEREKISIVEGSNDDWQAGKRPYKFSYGPSPLIAAMRCFVASKLGDEVEIPEELT